VSDASEGGDEKKVDEQAFGSAANGAMTNPGAKWD